MKMNWRCGSEPRNRPIKVDRIAYPVVPLEVNPAAVDYTTDLIIRFL